MTAGRLADLRTDQGLIEASPLPIDLGRALRVMVILVGLLLLPFLVFGEEATAPVGGDGAAASAITDTPTGSDTGTGDDSSTGTGAESGTATDSGVSTSSNRSDSIESGVATGEKSGADDASATGEPGEPPAGIENGGGKTADAASAGNQDAGPSPAPKPEEPAKAVAGKSAGAADQSSAAPKPAASAAGSRDRSKPSPRGPVRGKASKAPAGFEPPAGVELADLEDAADLLGIPVASVSTDYSPDHLISSRANRTHDGSCVTCFLMYARSEDVMKTVTAVFEADINSGELKIAENSVSNAIIIRAKEPESVTLKNVLQVIRSLDSRPGQVMIDVLVVELAVTDDELFDFELKGLVNRPFGMKNTVNTTALDHGTIEVDDPTRRAEGFKSLITSSNKMRLFLNAYEKKGRANVMSSPQILAANHRKATFKIGNKVPIISSIRPSDAGPIKQFEIKEVGIELNVTPHINQAGQIDLEVQQLINQLLNYDFKEGTANMSNREIQTNVTLADSETLVLGGFIETKKNDNQKRIPVLSNLPVIGKAFTQRQKSQTKTELMVFITPKIVDTVESARSLAQARTEKLSFKNQVQKLLAERHEAGNWLKPSQEIIIDRASRNWQYDFGTRQIEVLAWQVPPQFDPGRLVLKRVGACPFGYGASKRFQPPFVRTLLQPADGFVMRKEFIIDDPSRFRTLSLRVASNNAAAVYLNGRLIDEDPAMKLADGHDYEYWNRSRDDVPGTLLRKGANSLVVVLGNDKSTTDGYLDLMLVGNR